MRTFLLLTLIAAGGCGAKNTCVPGQSAACVCNDGGSGAQVCRNDGSYGTCDCGGRAAGSGGNGGDDMAMAGGDMSFVPVELQNAGALVTDQYQCGSPMMNCANYDITFVLHANATLARLEKVKLTIGGTTFTPSSAIYCASTPWDTEYGKTVGPIDLQVTTGSNGTFAPHLYYPCNGTSESVVLDGPATPAQTSGVLTLAIDGILSDASPFVAQAAAPLR